jgi:hypothetical protein
MKSGWDISPYENRPEIGNNIPLIIPGSSPIKYPTIWDREREVLCFNPRFLPNTITFDRKNRPVIRTGIHDVVARHATVYYSHVWVQEVYIQTLNASGQWISLSLSGVMKDKIPDWNNDSILSGTFQAEERVVFDVSGNAYSIVKTQNHGDFLLHSQDDMENWDVYAIPVRGSYRIEMTASDRPPVITVFRNQALSIIAPEKKQDGALGNLSLIGLVTRDADPGPSHSGVGDLSVTLNNKTHVVYLSTPDGQKGSPQYIVTYNHDDEIVTGPRLLGFTESSIQPDPDPHNGPAIVADSQGFLHVVLGSHQKPFKYMVSRRPNDPTSWTRPVELRNKFTEQETYVSLLNDREDTLHLVSRMVDDEGYSLHYMRKKRDDRSWSDVGKLVIPKPTHYSIWYHKLTIDKIGRLFLAYFYYSVRLTAEELKAYRRKWPNEEEITADVTNAHDPVILISGDSGYSWKIATTQDMITPWYLLAVNSPEWSDASGWKDVTNYSTIRTAVVDNELYLLARADRGIHTWKFNSGNNRWSRLASNSPGWSDASGWKDVTNYSTIRTAVVDNELYLLGRADKGIDTLKFNPGANRWYKLASHSPGWSDASGWNDISNYSTIQTAVVNNELYLLARANNGIHTWRLNERSPQKRTMSGEDLEEFTDIGNGY